MGLALVLAAPAAQARDSGYPSKGKALDQLSPASDYTDVMQGRPRALGIMRARANGFVPSPVMHDYVRGVLARLLRGVPLPPTFNPDVRILAAPEFSALCTPDGTIVLTIGLTLITTVLSSLLTINDDNSYYRNVIRRRAKKFR